MVIIPLDGQRFHTLTPQRRGQVRAALQRCSTSAGLAGEVCLVWTYARRTHFMAPKPWHPFFRGLSMAAVQRSLNKRLTCKGF